MIEPAAVSHHAGYDGAHAEEHAALVDGDDLVPLVVVGLDADRANLDSGVVDEHVDRAVGLLHGGHDLAPRAGIGHVVVVI